MTFYRLLDLKWEFIYLFLDNTKKNFKRKKDLDLDFSSSPFMIAVLGVFSVDSFGLRFLRIALDLFCRSRSKSSLFNFRSDRLFWPISVFRSDVYDVVLLRCYLWGFCFIFNFFVCHGLRVEDGFVGVEA